MKLGKPCHCSRAPTLPGPRGGTQAAHKEEAHVLQLLEVVIIGQCRVDRRALVLIKELLRKLDYEGRVAIVAEVAEVQREYEDADLSCVQSDYDVAKTV